MARKRQEQSPETESTDDIFGVEPVKEEIVDESPAEQKIEELVRTASEPQAPAVAGWNSDMSAAPTDSRPVVVSEDGKDRGTVVFWSIRRKANREKLRYDPVGRWTDRLTKQDIDFKPRYWREYNPEEFWPVRTQ